MIGCCGNESLKFRDANGEVDAIRLEKLRAELYQEECLEPAKRRVLERLESCDCPCHDDGKSVMC